MSQTNETSQLMLAGLRRLARDASRDGQRGPDARACFTTNTAVACHSNGVWYRGYSIDDLAGRCSFLEISWLLLRGELPDQELLADFRSVMIESTVLDPVLERWLESVPLHVSIMDVLRTSVSMLSHFDASAHDRSREASVAKAQRLLAQIPAIISARTCLAQGRDLCDSDLALSYAGNLLYLLTGHQPTAVQEKALDVCLILRADDGITTSTFAGRTVSAACSDVYSAVTAAVGAMNGREAIACSQRLLRLLKRAEGRTDTDRFVREEMARAGGICGFQSRWDDEDPRVLHLTRLCRRLAAQSGLQVVEETAKRVEQAARFEGGLIPNTDWPTIRLLHYAGLPAEMHAAVISIARIPAWSAHAIEQAEAECSIRPIEHYVGAERRPVVPLEHRN